ncbi:ADP-ribosylglycohydrolase family protein [uncultured Friedmanniella sp.]|uniref:ADP-ribosylglycohydrolase family protein n=1 Tax=uncultured Friedmanniella sp. TaxID=335381 RepID=UPI0035CC5B73
MSPDVGPMPALVDAYRHSTIDPLRPRDLLADEVSQRWESGYDVTAVVAEANATDADDGPALLELVDRMADLERRDDWAFEEPETLADIRASLPAVPTPTSGSRAGLADQLHAAWLGRVVGCNVGKPLEWGWHWTAAHIRDYLERAGAYPLDDYVPVLDPMPAAFVLRENWPETTRGNVNGSARDDDIDYPILALHLLETYGRSLRPEHVGEAWTTLFPLRQVYTAERAAYVNLTLGLEPPRTATFRNPYREWIGAQIRGDMFGYVHPGDPWAAAELSYADASLSHTTNGVYGEMWAAALVAAAFDASSALEAVTVSLGVVPPRSRLAAALRHVLELHADGVTWEQALTEIQRAYGHHSWVHTINNAAAVVAGLLWHEDQFAAAVGAAVMSGWDTDCNGATVGSVAGILAGDPAGLPTRLVEPLHDRTRSALFGFDNSSISDLAARTHALAAGGLARVVPARG